LRAIGYFPRAKNADYIKRKIREILRDHSNKNNKRLDLTTKLNFPHEIFRPYNPEVWRDAGYLVINDCVIANTQHFKHYKIYKGGYGYGGYRAVSQFGKMYALFIPLLQLHDFLAEQAKIDYDQIRWYNSITLREGDNNSYNPNMYVFDSAEELLEWLERGGSGQRNKTELSAGYIQVIFMR
jgi:hypothetical protein